MSQRVPARLMRDPACQPAVPELIEWLVDGAARFRKRVSDLADEDFATPSALAGWSRAHLIAHVALNAHGLVNLLDWARTGVETPMYASAAQRDADIAANAQMPPATLRRGLAEADSRLESAVRAMPADAWTASVRTAQGRVVGAREVPWMRVREVWVHLVDADAAASFAAVPPAILEALLDDAARTMTKRGVSVNLTLIESPGARRYRIGSDVDATRLYGDRSALAAYLLRGRTDGVHGRGQQPPDAPRWL